MKFKTDNAGAFAAEAVWSPLEERPEWALTLQRDLGLPPLLARIMANRGFSAPREAEAFLHPKLSDIEDPFAMRDMDRAVERLSRALRGGERIAVFGDYDIDGLTATALALRLFRWLGAEADSYIPHRVNEGYGLNIPALEALAKRGVRVVLTVDNGVTSLEEVDHANRLGMDVVVTDHHLPGEQLPRAAAVVDPHRADCSYPCPDLAGVGVMFKLAHALTKHLSRPAEEAKAFLRENLDLVGIGSIGDIVPLLGENRILAYFGLKEARRSKKAGLRAMLDLLGLARAELSPRAVGFVIGPRINAAGRTEHADIALELLMTEDEVRAREIVRRLDRLNEERRRIEADIFEEAVEVIEADAELKAAPVIVVAGQGWHHGVVGIVASRLLERYGRPVVVVGLEADRAKGSARSVAGFDIVAALEACSRHLTEFGGHAAAAGMELKPDRLGVFRQAITAFALERLGGAPLRPQLAIDVEARLEDLTPEAIEALRGLEPHGLGNPKPVVLLRGVRLTEPARIVGTNHLRLTLSESGRALGAIGFGMGRHAAWLRRHGGALDVVGEPSIDEFNGRRTPQLELNDIRPSSPQARPLQ